MGYKQEKLIVGVDEAGRGPLAGPVAIGVAVVPHDFDWVLLEGVGDSKMLSPKKRGEIFERAKELKKSGALDFVVVMGSAKEIDTTGIAVVIKNCIKKSFKKLRLAPERCFIKLDGSLHAPADFKQETIIKGDSKELIIGLASICAKETRDEYMKKISKKYPQYGFDIHKGYGTKQHRELIGCNGLSAEHRATYCQNRHLWGTVVKEK